MQMTLCSKLAILPCLECILNPDTDRRLALAFGVCAAYCRGLLTTALDAMRLGDALARHGARPFE